MKQKIFLILLLLIIHAFIFIHPSLHAEDFIKPYISVRDPRQPGELIEPLPITNIGAEIKIHGCFAETSITMTFGSDYHDNLEGSLYFPLPSGATINGYALDIQGQMVEGVVVEKEKAAYIFETEVRRAIDPGLVEWAGGNVFRTRVYPIPPRGHRTIMVRYVSLLDEVPSTIGNEYRYTLPLRTDYPIGTVDVQIEIVTDKDISIHWQGAFSMNFQRNGSVYRAASLLYFFEFKDDLVLRLSEQERERVWVERSDKDDRVYFVVQDAVKPDRSIESMDVLYVLWDASASIAESARERNIELVRAILEKLKPQTVYVIPFRDSVDNVLKFQSPKASTSFVLQALQNISFDGATNLNAGLKELGKLTLKETNKDGICFLFSDAGQNFGAEKLPSISCPIYIISDAPIQNVLLVRTLVRDSGGAIFNISTVSEAVILQKITHPVESLRHVEYDGARITDVLWDVDDEWMGPITVCGKLLDDSGSLVLYYGSDREKKVQIDSQNVQKGESIRTYWAQLLVNNLSAFPDSNRGALIEAGKTYGLVTPHTSLLVLETLNQYDQYRMEPPESLKEMRQQYYSRVEEQTEKYLERENDRFRKSVDDLISFFRIYQIWRVKGNPKEKTGSHYTMSKTYPKKHRYYGGCFSAGTAVLTKVGSKAIEKISPGESVYTWDVRSSTWQLEQVIKRQVHEYSGDVVTIYVEDAKIRTTGNHYFWVVQGRQLETRLPAKGVPQSDKTDTKHGRWVEARHLEVGDVLMTKRHGEVPIIHLETIQDSLMVYNVAVPHLHTYAVHDAGIVVHNHKEKEEVKDEIETIPGLREQYIAIEQWDARTTYLKKMKRKSSTEAYQVYLKEREGWEKSPAFYVDCAEWFFRHGDHVLGARVISNIFEKEYLHPVVLRSAIYVLEAYGELELGKQFLEYVLKLNPQSFHDLWHLAVLEGKLGNYDLSLELHACVAMQSWTADWYKPKDEDGDEGFGGIRLAALIDYARIKSIAERKGVETSEYLPKEIPVKNFDSDLRVILEWSNPDYSSGLLVVEPGREEAYYNNFRTNAGGLVTPVYFLNPGPDIYQIREAPGGSYRVKFINHEDYWWQITGPTVLKASIYTDFGRPNEVLREVVLRIPDQEKVIDIAEITWGTDE